MPKKPEVKKSVTKPQPVAAPAKKEEPRVVVYRLFECLMRLEEASNQISRVGIFPGPEDKANVFQYKLKTAKAAVDDILKEYQTAWGAMQK